MIALMLIYIRMDGKWNHLFNGVSEHASRDAGIMSALHIQYTLGHSCQMEGSVKNPPNMHNCR